MKENSKQQNLLTGIDASAGWEEALAE